MRTTRIRGCRTRGCPWPSNPDAHECWVCLRKEVSHQHVPKRSQGGKKIQAMLCATCHDNVDNRALWRNYVEDGIYVMTDWDGTVLARREVATGEAI